MGAAVEDLQFGKFLRGCVLHLVNLQTGTPWLENNCWETWG